jgi:putative FmdB family regulatory protein
LPTYQYRCTECDHAFEQFQSFTDDALTICPACGGRLRTVFNAVGVVFKGSGFYRNDSRPNGTATESPAAKETAGSSDSSSKPADSSSTSSDSSSKDSPSKASDSSTRTSTPASTTSGSGSTGS